MLGDTVVGATTVGATTVGATTVGVTTVGVITVGATTVGVTTVGVTTLGVTTVGATTVGVTHGAMTCASNWSLGSAIGAGPLIVPKAKTPATHSVTLMPSGCTRASSSSSILPCVYGGGTISKSLGEIVARLSASALVQAGAPYSSLVKRISLQQPVSYSYIP